MTLHPDIQKVLDRIPEEKLRDMSLESLSDLHVTIDEARGYVDELDRNADYDAQERLNVEAFRVACRGDVWTALDVITRKLNTLNERFDALLADCICGAPMAVQAKSVTGKGGEMYCSHACAARAEIDT